VNQRVGDYSVISLRWFLDKEAFMLGQPLTGILIFIIVLLAVFFLAEKVGISENVRNIILVGLFVVLLVLMLLGKLF
jgi:hypothetical protein